MLELILIALTSFIHLACGGNLTRNVFGTWKFISNFLYKEKRIFFFFFRRRRELNKNKLNLCKYLDDTYMLSNNYHTLPSHIFTTNTRSHPLKKTVTCIEIVFLDHNSQV